VVLGLAGCPHRVDKEKCAKRLDLAKDALVRGKLDEAESEANKTIACNPRDEEAHNLVGLVHVIRASLSERSLVVDDCMTGVDAEALRSDQDEEYAAADKAFTKATKLAPDYGEAWSNRGGTSMAVEDYDAAAKYYEEALLHPERLENPSGTRASLGWAQFYRGDMVAAAKELLLSLQFQPGNCFATYRLGRVYFAREEWEKAAEQFQGVTDDPSCGLQEGGLYLMKSRIEQGLIADAASARDACLTMAPKSCVAAQCRTDGSTLP
jgi:tetratricopeptide (TPR) repeat protein